MPRTYVEIPVPDISDDPSQKGSLVVVGLGVSRYVRGTGDGVPFA